MICLIKRFLIDTPNSEEIRVICFYKKNHDLYYKLDRDDVMTIENDSIKITTLEDIAIYLPYLSTEDIKEIYKILRISKISKLLEE